ncbi:pilus assembly protein TadG-related protein [Dactylosporangium matsuzakiense]|uniref:pilus assembly protein TadG-related protein n=1 Tax=Dactylosporangium matsuzakiense TaxID=53360 RepID=UPI0021C440F9|nr:pilus assembly protein TadG-related protein [Dactylosporangium matsuzakiense]UWZ48631.1 hypothetical protein Dmats_20810 [Dactylosporangium matsuzakiense]
MRRLRPGSASDRDGDRGAVVTVFAVLLSAGVLLGLATIVIDVGAALDERGQLANGADGAAWAAAQFCIANTGCTSATARTAGLSAATGNARDGTAEISVCGSFNALTACPAGSARSTTNLRPCLGSDPASGNFVKATTYSRGPGGSSAAPTYFAGAVGAKAAYPQSCSRVQWGPMKTGATVMAFGIAQCSYNTITTNGTVFGPVAPVAQHVTTPGTVPPAKGVTGPVQEGVVPVRSLVSLCPGITVGGLAWLTASVTSCLLNTVSVGDNLPVGTILPAGTAPCRTAIAAAYTAREPLLVPIYDSVSVSLPPTFHVAGFAAFVVTGYYFATLPPVYQAPMVAANNCTLLGLTNCVNGYFTKGLTPANIRALASATAAAGADRGVEVIARSG